MPPSSHLVIAVVAMGALMPPCAPARAQEVKLVERFGVWALHVDAEQPHQFCFLTSEPRTSIPKDANRDAPRAYVSAWPKDGIKGQISFRLGFSIGKKPAGTAKVGEQSYTLFASADRAFVDGDADEQKLLDAMRKGAEMTVSAVSARGTIVTDTYTLTGITQALQRLQATCF